MKAQATQRSKENYLPTYALRGQGTNQVLTGTYSKAQVAAFKLPIETAWFLQSDVR